MTDDNAASMQQALKNSQLNLGLDLSAATNMGISKAYFDALAPSVSSLVGPMFASSSLNIGSIIAQSIDTSGISKLISGMVESTAISQHLADTYASLTQHLYPSLSDLYPSLEMAGVLGGSNVELQETISSLTSSVAQSIDTSFARSLLSQASALRDELDRQAFDEDIWAFHEAPLEDPEPIEGLIFPVALSPAERQLVVWFIGTIVAIYVTMGVANISLDSEELGALLSGLGIAGPSAGVVAGKVTGKLLDKLPEAGAEES